MFYGRVRGTGHTATDREGLLFWARQLTPVRTITLALLKLHRRRLRTSGMSIRTVSRSFTFFAPIHPLPVLCGICTMREEAKEGSQ